MVILHRSLFACTKITERESKNQRGNDKLIEKRRMRGCCSVAVPSPSSASLSPAPISIHSAITTASKHFLSLNSHGYNHYRVWCCSSSASVTHSKPPRPSESNTERRRRREPKTCNNDESGDFVVVNFYKFVFVKDPEVEVEKHLAFLEELNIHGRIYLNEQGINAQYSGPSKDAIAYVEWLKEDERFSDILVQISPAIHGHAFPKLKMRYKPSLVQLEGGISHLPLLDQSMRAIPLEPSEWRKKLEAVKDANEASNSNLNTNMILLDVRNGYEWDIGHFDGANRPDVDCFRSTSFGLSQTEAVASDPLAHIDKEKTDVLMYCTGGIRCDVYSTILRQQGFRNLYTLKGGVSHYLENEGPVGWVGNLFVFDSRLSLPPSTYKSETAQVSENPFATCRICGSQVRELRHRNCANLDCNLLFLSCADCVKNLRGCCCLNCTTAPRLRPILPGHERYKKWHIYRDSELQSNLGI